MKEIQIIIEYKGVKHESAIETCDEAQLEAIQGVMENAASGKIEHFSLKTNSGGYKYFSREILVKSVIEVFYCA